MSSVQISNTARHTGNSYAEDTANFAADGNTFFLDNFDLNQFPGGIAVAPITQVDAPANAWMALHIGELGCCGGTYNVSGLNITSRTGGIYAGAAGTDIFPVTPKAPMYGNEISRNPRVYKSLYAITALLALD